MCHAALGNYRGNYGVLALAALARLPHIPEALNRIFAGKLHKAAPEIHRAMAAMPDNAESCASGGFAAVVNLSCCSTPDPAINLPSTAGALEGKYNDPFSELESLLFLRLVYNSNSHCKPPFAGDAITRVQAPNTGSHMSGGFAAVVNLSCSSTVDVAMDLPATAGSREQRMG